GLAASAAGWCASCWPQLSRAIELCGGIFVALLARTLLTLALGATHAFIAVVLLRDEWEGSRLRAVAAAIALWAAATGVTGAVLARGWGFGPRSLAEAAGVPSHDNSPSMTIAWLNRSAGGPVRLETVRLSSESVDLSADSLARLEAFLDRTRFRGVFTQEALAAVRLGHRLRWDEERALDAAMISVPGRAHPDYLRALELIRAGPLSAERYAKLERLSQSTGRRVEGFEKAGESQLIFEGFSAAYARFGEEAKAREWLRLLDGLWAVSEKRIEAGSLEDMRDGRVEGSVFLGARPAGEVRVGLFLVWRSSATQTTHFWLSGSRAPDESGRFSFEQLGPGRYVLALLGALDDVRGEYVGEPGVIEVTYEHPDVLLDPIILVSYNLPGAQHFDRGRDARRPLSEGVRGN
ncbi:MAG: hypothetical protein HYZ74_04980, partial [Elusimicrobia bacterium]|nr:hypothetical protein [Elusimicrobiota bacterium]